MRICWTLIIPFLFRFVVYTLSFTLLLVQFSFAQVPDFNAGVTRGCSPIVVQFSDLSTGSPSAWNWDFGNGNTSTLQNPSAIYSTPGTYTVSLTINGSLSITKTEFITVHSDPIVDFSADTQSGCTPLSVSFNDNSTPVSGALTSWDWVFGDGGVSNEQNPEHTYDQAGNYSVTLTATNQFGCESVLTKTNFIEVEEFKAEFQADKTDFCEFPAEVNFTNLSVGPGTLSYTWNFGDGSSSSELNPKHTYTGSGSYTVTLQIRSSVCSFADSYDLTLNVGNKPAPDFNVIPEISCTGESVSFLAGINSDVTNWSWDFGDNTTSSAQNTSHVYTVAGSYNAKLTATFSDGCTSTSTQEVTVLNPPSPDFKSKQDCDKGVLFENISNFSDSYLWNFGDGTFSTEKNPFHEYSALGSYRVRLVATNDGCSRTYERFINVGNPIIADFKPFITSTCGDDKTLGGCLPKTIEFEDISFSQNGILTWLWDFGDGSTSSEASPTHTYTVAGDFTAALTITDQFGCTSTKEQQVNVVPADKKPMASFEVDKTEACVLEVVRLTDTSTGEVDLWCWDVGDGRSFQTTQPALTFTYNDVGVYTISLSVSYKGCPSDNNYVLTDVITVLDPKPEFSVSKDCIDTYTVFVENDTENADSFLWDFGDGQTSTVADPGTHTYSETGNYIISLLATNNATGCTVRTLNAINIYDVQSDFTVSNTNVCINEGIKFNNLSTDAVRWVWNFGDGRTSSTMAPSNVKYTSPGKYTIALTSYDWDGCSDYLGKTDLIVVADIQGEFQKKESLNFCDSLKVEFEDLSLATPDIEEWLWDFGDGITSTEQNPVHTYSDFGDYNISLTIKNAEGQCTVLEEDLVKYTEPLPDFEFSKSAFCVNEEISLLNNSRNAQTYAWYIDEDTLLSINPAISFATRGVREVTLEATDKDDCSNRITKQVIVQKPSAAFTAQQISAECPPLTSTFLSTETENVVQWDWRINDEFFSSFENPAHTFNFPGKYDISLVVTDNIGCIDSSRFDELVKLGGPFGSYSVDRDTGCLSQEVLFEASATNTVSYLWDFGDGVVRETNVPDVDYSYQALGTFNPGLILEDEFGCRVPISQNTQINIYDTTAVSFSIPVSYPFTGEMVQILYDEFPAGSWTWYMGDGNIITDAAPDHTYSEGGIHSVELVFTNENGCRSRFSQSVFIQEDIKFIPNVFTPNGDGKNDYFDMLELENGFWDIKIFDRHGKSIYEKKSYDGKWTARDVSAGIYYYHVVNQFRSEKIYKGYIQVLK